MKLRKFAETTLPTGRLYNLFVKNSQIYRSATDNSLYFTYKLSDSPLLLSEKNVCNAIVKLETHCFHRTVKLSVAKEVYTSIKASAEDCVDYRTIAKLVCKCGDTIYYDCNNPYTVLRISPDGINEVNRDVSEVLFIRDSKSKNIPSKINYGVLIDDFLPMLKGIFHVQNDQLLLLAVYIIALFVPDINHPLLVIDGEYGAGKSFALKLISRIIDRYHGIETLPVKLDDIANILNDNYFTAFDNVGYITKAVSDLLCVAVTDGNYSKRKLFSDTEVVSLNIHKPVAINGLGLNLTQSDLLDRVIILFFERINDSERIDEAVLYAKFDQKLPKLLGIIFLVLKKALPNFKTVTLKSLPRLADFGKVGYCIAEALHEGYGDEFLKQYRRNISSARHTAIENNPLLDTVEMFMSDKTSWTGSMTELLQELKKLYLKNSVSDKLPTSFPLAPNTLSKKLKVYQNDLKELKIKYEFFKKTTRGIIITKE